MSADLASLRVDKWLWAARFFKTRSLAVEAIEHSRVQVNGQTTKASRELRLGDRLEIRQGNGADSLLRCVIVRGLSAQRGPAPVAQALYDETADSLAARQRAQAERALRAEPAHAIEQGRPTKRDRRQLVQWQRWSVSLDDDAAP